MRNLIQYPIELDEVISALDLIAPEGHIGGVNPFIEHRLAAWFTSNPHMVDEIFNDWLTESAK